MPEQQHFVPKFVLRRFVADGGPRPKQLWRLEKSTGRVMFRGPRQEASLPGYYDLPPSVISDASMQPERVLMRIESDAATALRKLERDPRTVTAADVLVLSFFALIQTNRTPMGRRELRFFDELLAKEMAGMKLGVRERAVKMLREMDPSLSEEDAEQRRSQIVNDLDAGQLVLSSTPEREVASMFLGIDSTAVVAQRCDFELVRLPPPAQLVLSDVGITQYDPSPQHPFASSGFLGSPTVENAIHVSPISALVITPGEGRVGVVDADLEYANELNFRAYASAEQYIYGPSRDSVEVVHRLAIRNPDIVHERRRRPKYLWFAERVQGQPEPFDGVYTFKGHSIDGVRTSEIHVDPRAFVGSKPLRAEDLW